jgi:hypothetical protein
VFEVGCLLGTVRRVVLLPYVQMGVPGEEMHRKAVMADDYLQRPIASWHVSGRYQSTQQQCN